MIKKIFSFFILHFSFFILTDAQQAWYPVEDGIIGDGGIFTEAVYNGELYAGGWFYTAGTLNAYNIARWNGLTWDSVGSGLTGGYNNVYSLCVYNGKLYAGGAFFAADGLPTANIAMWNGSNWNIVGSGLIHCGGGAGWVGAMAVYNGKLYVAGSFCQAGGVTAKHIACWNGTQWDSVSLGINDTVNALTVYNGKLYAGGEFTRAGKRSAKNMACWNDTVWDSVGTGTNEPVFALQVYNNALYAGGEFTTAGGISAKYLAKWNGSAWSSPGSGFTSNYGVGSMCIFNGELIAGGLFSKNGTLKLNNIATWNGTIWDTLGKGINNSVNALVVYDSAVYAGGQFTTAGNIQVNNIAAWGGKELGINQISTINQDGSVFPNPTSGVFRIQFSGVNGEYSVLVYNMLGEMVCSQPNIHNSTFTVNISNQPDGIFLYRIVDEKGMFIASGKIIKI